MLPIVQACYSVFTVVLKGFSVESSTDRLQCVDSYSDRLQFGDSCTDRLHR